MNTSVSLKSQNAAPTPYGDFARQMNSRRIVGKPLRFNKGDWLVGAKDAQSQLQAGTTLAVVMPTLLVGWIKWVNGDVADDNVGVVAEGFKMPRRRELGDEDSDRWPLDEKTGERKDPWQKTSSIIMIDRSLSDVYTFTTNRRPGGDIPALRRLRRAPAGKRPRPLSFSGARGWQLRAPR
jgi:hypothetical protein